MLFLPSGRADVSRHLRLTLPLAPEVSRSQTWPYDLKVRRQICDVVLASILDKARLDAPICYYVDIEIVADLETRDIRFRAPFRLDVCCDPADLATETARPREDSLRDTLRQILEEEVDRRWRAFDIDLYLMDVTIVASSLRLLYAEGRPVDWLLEVLQRLEPILLRYGYDLDDAVDLGRLRMDMPDEVPVALRAPGSCASMPWGLPAD